MKKLILLASLAFIAQAASAAQICTIRTRMYIPKSVINQYVTAKMISEVADWQECYLKALQEAKDYKPLQTARVQIKIFNVTVSDRDRHFHFLTDWTAAADSLNPKMMGTVNEASSANPAVGSQSR